eukprot:m.1656595 g.1656595  ORF g.1656595 m.1656595 type:complete len:67 (-) comp108216_c0_seq1:219-419(-)
MLNPCQDCCHTLCSMFSVGSNSGLHSHPVRIVSTAVLHKHASTRELSWAGVIVGADHTGDHTSLES